MLLVQGRWQPPQACAFALAFTRTHMERPKDNSRRSPEEGGRVNLEKILKLAESVLGSNEKARHWLDSPNRALVGVTPLSTLETEGGAHEVTKILGRIEYGVYS